MGQFRYWIFLAVINICIVQQSFVCGVEDEAFNSHFPTAWASSSEITSLCYNDSQSYLQSYLNGEKWAFELYKATGLMTIEGMNNFDVFSSSPGLFDECLSVESPYSFHGQYCSAFFKLVPFKSNEESEGMVEADEQDGDEGTYGLPRVGFCIPSSCSPSDFRSSVKRWVTRNSLNVNQTSLIVTINDDNYCYTKKKVDSITPPFDGPTITVLVTFGLLAILVVSGTLFDGWRLLNNNSIDTKTKKILLCFSALENGRKVLSTEVTSSDLSCLHGLRFLSATWIMLHHVYLLTIVRQRQNKFGPEKSILKDWASQAFTRGTVAVDTFFMMSGLLVCYSLLRELRRNNGRFNLFYFYLHRFIRISPFYFLHIGFMSTLVVYLGTGPLWQYVRQYSQSCRSTWWTHFLYVKNHFMVHACSGQAWYLAADMQLFILSPLFVYPLWRWRRVGLIWIIFLIAVVIGTIGTLFTIWSLPIVNTFLERPIGWDKNVYKNYYFESWNRMPQYLAGILLGWFIILKSESGVVLNRILVVLCWIMSMATIVFIVYGMVPFLDEELVPEMNSIFRISYGTLSSFAWALVVCWVVFACINGYGGLINTILSWKGFLPLGRLTFTAYLIHEDFIQVYHVGLSRVPFYYTKMNLVTLYLVVLMASFMMAFVGSIAIEMPFINLDREFLTSRSKQRNDNNLANTIIKDAVSNLQEYNPNITHPKSAAKFINNKIKKTF